MPHCAMFSCGRTCQRSRVFGIFDRIMSRGCVAMQRVGSTCSFVNRRRNVVQLLSKPGKYRWFKTVNFCVSHINIVTFVSIISTTMPSGRRGYRTGARRSNLTRSLMLEQQFYYDGRSTFQR